MKSWLQDNDIEMFSTHNKGRSDQKYLRTLKNKIYECMTTISKNMYIDKLDNIVNRDNNTYHSTIKMRPTDVESLPLIRKIIKKILNLKLVKILEYQNIKAFL